MSKYYSMTLRIISIITLIAFVCTQVAFGLEELHLRAPQFSDRMRSLRDAEKNDSRQAAAPASGKPSAARDEGEKRSVPIFHLTHITK